MTISNAWHFVEDGKQVGPFTEDEMTAFVRQGRVRSDTLVWYDGMMDWMPLHLSTGAALLLAADAAIRSSAPPLPGGVNSGDGSQGPGAPMGFFDAISSCFSKYVQFSGRASRSEFWYFNLFGVICSIIITVISGSRMPIHLLFSLGMFLPSLAVCVRRLHDTDRSGWWQMILLIPLIGMIVLLVFFCQRPTPGRNRFG